MRLSKILCAQLVWTQFSARASEPPLYETYSVELSKRWAPVCYQRPDGMPGLVWAPARASLENVPRTQHLQSICAGAAFGGHPSTNLGGFCFLDESESNSETITVRPRMAFERLQSSSVAFGHPFITRLHMPILEMFCMIRCKCERPGLGLQTPAFAQMTFPPEVKDRIPGVQISLDVAGIEIFPVGRSHTDSLMRIDELIPNNRDTEVKPLEAYWIGLDKVNWLKCSRLTPVPPFQLRQEHLPWSRFKSFQELCAASLSGGHPTANAGGVCKRYNGRRYPYFLNNYTPDVRWTSLENPSQWHMAWAIRAWCWTKCSCWNDVKDDAEPGQTGPIPYFNDAKVDIKDGEISVLQQETYSDSAGTFELTRKVMLYPDPTGSGGNGGGNGGGSGSGSPQRPGSPGSPDTPRSSCNETAGDYCGLLWPTSILGPEPGTDSDSISPIFSLKTPRPARLSVSTLDIPSEISVPGPQCGGSCMTNSDCPLRASEKSCACRAQGTRLGDGRMVFFAAVCWALERGVVGKGWLLGRGVEEVEREGFSCPCNGTYVSDSCCGSEDGMVWEEPALKRGVLGGEL